MRTCPHCHAELTPSTARKAKVRTIDHTDATSDHDATRRAYFTATNPETTALFYAAHVGLHPDPTVHQAWRMSFLAVAGECESSTAPASTRLKAVWGMADAFRAAARAASVPAPMSAEHYARFVARQSDAWRNGVPGAPMVLEYMPAAVADELAPAAEPLTLERELDSPAKAA